MIQSGEQSEHNLIAWVSMFGCCKSVFEARAEANDTAGNNVDVLIPVLHVSCQTVPETYTCNTQEPALVVNLPPHPPIVNELLCFVQNKVKQLPYDSLVQLCTDFYSIDVVIAAKELLYRAVTPKGRYITRKGANKAKLSMGDIVKIFLEMEVANAPTFVAYNLMNLPPLRMDSMDCLKVIQELEAMRAQIKYVSSSQLDLVNFVKSGMTTPRVSETSCASSQTGTATHEIPDLNSGLLDGNLCRNNDSTSDLAHWCYGQVVL
jgi:hypothetical protein